MDGDRFAVERCLLLRHHLNADLADMTSSLQVVERLAHALATEPKHLVDVQLDVLVRHEPNHIPQLLAADHGAADNAALVRRHAYDVGHVFLLGRREEANDRNHPATHTRLDALRDGACAAVLDDIDGVSAVRDAVDFVRLVGSLAVVDDMVHTKLALHELELFVRGRRDDGDGTCSLGELKIRDGNSASDLYF